MSETSKLIEGRTGPWEVVLGLEIHAQVASNAKLKALQAEFDKIK